MKRVGDEIRFDSAIQKQRFEDVLFKQRGVEKLIRDLLSAIGQVDIDSTAAWKSIADKVGIDQSKEVLSFDWVDRKLKVRKLDDKMSDTDVLAAAKVVLVKYQQYELAVSIRNLLEKLKQSASQAKSEVEDGAGTGRKGR